MRSPELLAPVPVCVCRRKLELAAGWAPGAICDLRASTVLERETEGGCTALLVGRTPIGG